MSSEPHHNAPEKKYSPTELMASAKVVAEAAQSGFGKGADGKAVDKGKVASAAGDLLDAVGQYAKLDDQKGLGQYVDKAADYLHHYHPTNNAAAAATADHHHSPTSKPDHHKTEHDSGKSESEGGHGHGHGIGDFAKTAGGFFK